MDPFSRMLTAIREKDDNDRRDENREWMIRQLRAILTRENSNPVSFQRATCKWARDALRRLGAEPTAQKSDTDANSSPPSKPQVRP